MSNASIEVFDQRILTSDLETLIAPFQRQLFKILGYRILSGPFKGTITTDHAIWKDCSTASKLYGYYEKELHDSIEKAVSRRPAAIVNVGCANGYYAIGLACRLWGAQIHAFDIDERSLHLCSLMARANSCHDRVHVAKGCSRAEELYVSTPGHALYFLDCEGAEYALLDPALCPTLLKADIIVEYHDFITGEYAYKTLIERFSKTHDVDRILPTERGAQFTIAVRFPPPPGKEDHPVFALEVSDGRPTNTGWLAMWAKLDATFT